MSNTAHCTHCGSKRLVSIRKDSDWGDGGDLYRINDDSCYEYGDPSSLDEFDIEYTHCLNCGSNEPFPKGESSHAITE